MDNFESLVRRTSYIYPDRLYLIHQPIMLVLDVVGALPLPRVVFFTVGARETFLWWVVRFDMAFKVRSAS